MITLQDALLFHKILISGSGGPEGLRDEGLLESALQRPFSGFGDNFFYPTIEEKSAAVVESIVTNHPFLDGNKRSGYFLMRIFLLQTDKDIKASEDEKYDFIIDIASGKLEFKEILNWINERIIEK